MSKFSFSKIYFLVGDEETFRVRDLYQTISNYCQVNNLLHEYLDGTTKDKFKNALRQIRQEAKLKGIYPFIHIEAHGSKKGLMLYSKGRLTWKELTFFFTEINIACANNLFISFASCNGAYISLSLIDGMTLDKKIRAPLFGFVGPIDTMSYGELEIGFEKFFEALIYKQSDATTAIKELNLSRTSSSKYHYYSCEQMFVDFVSHFMKTDIERKFTSDLKLDSHIAQILKQYFQKTGKIPTKGEYQKLKNIITNEKYYVDIFNTIRRNYLMIDLYPENDKRFMKVGGITNWNQLLRNITL